MSKKTIKDIFDEKIDKNDIYKNITIKIQRNKKIMFNNIFKYLVSVSSIVFIFCVFVLNNNKTTTLVGNNINENKIYINKLDRSNTGTLAIDIDGKAIDIDDEIYKVLPFTKNINIPSDLKLSRAIEMYSRNDINDDNYSVFIGYNIMYNDNNYKDIDIFVSNLKETRIRDYSFNSDIKASKISNVDVDILGDNNFYVVFFKYNDLYFDIELRGIMESELICLIESIIKNI